MQLEGYQTSLERDTLIHKRQESPTRSIGCLLLMLSLCLSLLRTLLLLFAHSERTHQRQHNLYVFVLSLSRLSLAVKNYRSALHRESWDYDSGFRLLSRPEPFSR
jgi:hypothetical protein